ncbi:hypothetical protein BDE02_04G014200 [Populus trichocarpa]|nr:hypothetical protein BDE02_04G014200 [Populus trichocarpa]
MGTIFLDRTEIIDVPREGLMAASLWRPQPSHLGSPGRKERHLICQLLSYRLHVLGWQLAISFITDQPPPVYNHRYCPVTRNFVKSHYYTIDDGLGLFQLDELLFQG